MDQPSDLKGFFPTTKKIKWTQPRTAQGRRVGASNAQHNVPLAGVVPSKKCKPDHPHAGNVVKATQPPCNNQHWTHCFSRPSGLSKTRQRSTTTLNPVSKSSTSKASSLYLMPRQSAELTGSRNCPTRDGGTSLKPAIKLARAGNTATAAARVPIIVVPETPHRHNHHCKSTFRSRACDPTVTADFVVPETQPGVETSVIDVFSAKGQLSGGGLESTEDSDRSKSSDLLCGSRMSSIAESGEPKISADAYEYSRPISSRKRPRQEQNVPHLQHPYINRVDLRQPDRYSPPRPGGRTNPPLFHHQSTQIRKETYLRPDEATQRVDDQPGAQKATKRDGFCPSKGAQATEAAANNFPKCSSWSLGRMDHEARVAERDRVIERHPPVHRLLSAVASVGQARNHQDRSLENDITRLDVTPSFTVDSNAHASARSRLKAGATETSDGGRMTRGQVTTYRAVAASRVDRNSKPGLARLHVSSSDQLRPYTASSSMTRDKSSPMVPSLSKTVDCLHTNGATASAQRTEPSSICQSLSAAPVMRPTAVTVLTNTSNYSVSTALEHPRSTQRLSYGCGSLDDGDRTPPKKIFAREHQRIFKSSSGRGRGAMGRKRGRGRGGFAAGRGGKGRHSAPVAAQAPVTGGWRTQRGKKWYISLKGLKLEGADAYKAFEEDKAKLRSNGGRRVMDGSTILRGSGQGSHVDPAKDTDVEKQLESHQLKLSFYGVPEQLVDSYKKRGVEQLFPWQAHCLRVDNCKPCAGGNLVYSAPTSGGKTLVAEILLLRSLMERKGTMALLVVPFIALAMEKRDYLRDVWAPLELNVQACHGSEGGDSTAMESVHVAVCTIEKANSIVNRLAEETRLEALSIVVVDEMHLIGDSQRGFLLELMLSKLRMVCSAKVQLVCLSATLPNVQTLATWLDASLYETKYRPVELRHRVCRERKIFFPDEAVEGQGGFVEMGEIRPTRGQKRIDDQDGVVDLVEDALEKDMSVLVFCANKKWCHRLAYLLAGEIREHQKVERRRGAAPATVVNAIEATKIAHPMNLPPGQRRKQQIPNLEACRRGGQGAAQSGQAKDIGPQSHGYEGVDRRASDICTGFVTAKTVDGCVRTNHSELGYEEGGAPATGQGTSEESIARGGRVAVSTPAAAASAAVMDKLRETPVGLDPDLRYLVKYGVAFHHSGLVVEERTILEQAFREGSIRVLVATSTLAAGVNLPAHRVIIRSPKIGASDLDSTRYHQMAGRSGRAGVSRGKKGTLADQSVNTGAGESFLILPHNEDLGIARNLISTPLPPLESALRRATGGGLERALLEAVVSKLVNSRADATRFMSHTLLAAQEEASTVTEASNAATEFLLEHCFIVATIATDVANQGEDQSNVLLSPTQLGKATFFSGLSPSAAVDVQRSLDMACKDLVTNTDLHALYLVTPIDGLEPDWGAFRDVYTGWGDEDPARIVGKAVGIQEGVLVSAAAQNKPAYGARTYVSPAGSGRKVDLLPYRRFFAALVLQKAVEEVPLRDMAARMDIARGVLQGLQKDASVFCGMVVCFCRHLQWHELANVLFSFQDRLGYSARPELLPLVRLSRDLPPFRARALLEAGYPSPLELAAAEPSHLAQVFLRCSPFRSAGFDESIERYRALQSRRLAENIQALAINELRRQLAALTSPTTHGTVV